MTEVGVALFYTTSAVMHAEKLLQRQGIPVSLIPTPRTLSSDCGIALRCAAEQLEHVSVLLAQARIETAGLHMIAEADL